VARNTAYALGNFVRASDPPGGSLAEDYDDRIYECVAAGTTHATTQPTYDTTIGNDIGVQPVKRIVRPAATMQSQNEATWICRWC
jgi:hypothetical protein